MSYWFYNHLDKYVERYYPVKVEGIYARSIEVPEADARRMTVLFKIMTQPYFEVKLYGR